MKKYFEKAVNYDQRPFQRKNDRLFTVYSCTHSWTEDPDPSGGNDVDDDDDVAGSKDHYLVFRSKSRSVTSSDAERICLRVTSDDRRSGSGTTPALPSQERVTVTRLDDNCQRPKFTPESKPRAEKLTLSLEGTHRGQCYDRNFSAIFTKVLRKKLVIFLKTNVIVIFFCLSC
jgi:hypothetical protein